ncbi:MAG: hypothetical protein IJV14_07130 [Lachnospiraceae bacterium]|nr:hypothetical protein [Lachnospiraceae bacterium]
MNSSTVFIGMLITFVLVAAVMGIVNKKRFRRYLRGRFAGQFGQIPDKQIRPERFSHIGGYLRAHTSPFGIDDITWNDLDMDLVYKRIDQTQSAAGEEYLYYLLHTPAQAGEHLTLDAALPDAFSRKENEEARLSIQEILYRLGSTGDFSLYDYLDLLDTLEGRRNLIHILALVLPFFAVASMYFSTQVGIVLLIFVICWNISTYFREKRKIDPFLISFKYLLRLLTCAEEIAGVKTDDPALKNEQAKLRSLAGALRGFKAGSAITMSSSAYTGNPADVLMDYIRIIFHLDILKFNQMYASVKEHRNEFDRIITIVGRLDAAITAASFRRSLPHWCRPVFTDPADPASEKPELRIEGLFHPLLQDPVCNNIQTRRPVLLTGSNASGKSTFLKAVAICALLGQSIGICPAAVYEGEHFRIYSSMALRDSIESSESYFMVEIRSLKRILDAATIGSGAHGSVLSEPDGNRTDDEQKAGRVLCFVDEVLRGTNTIERISASTEIMKTLSEAGALLFAATHDIELTRLLQESFDNYHFEEELTGGDVHFSYEIKRGPATTRNAIRLLGDVGFAQSITQKAQERAETFERTGIWK